MAIREEAQGGWGIKQPWQNQWKKGHLSWHGPVSGTGKTDETRKLDGIGLGRRINFNQKKVWEYLSLNV